MNKKQSSTLKQPTCKSCNSKLTGIFCSNCGEKQINKDSYTIKHFLTHLIKELTNLDSKTYISFKLLLLRPGFLTQEYITGRRNLYLRPLQMFFITNILYFIIQPFTIAIGYNTSLKSQMNRQVYSNFFALESVVEQRVEQLDISFGEYEKLYNAKSSTFARSLIIIHIPLFALFLSFLFRNSKKYFVEHLEFSVHYFTWKLFLS